MNPNLLFAILLLLVITTGRVDAQGVPCWEQWGAACTVTAVQAGVMAVRGGLGLVPVAPVAVCQMTPSTGQGAGVNVRALPDIDSDVVGDIPLGEYREVTALSRDWVQTVTRGGDAGFVALRLAALVGPCGDVPRFVVTP
jgi:hypothetical protein